MEKKDFSISDALKSGWDTMKGNFWYFVGVLIVAFVVTAVPHAIAGALQDNFPGLSFLFRIIGWIADIIIAIGLITIALKFLDGQKPEFNDLFSFQPFFWKYLGASILTGLIVVAGFILLIIPGIYWLIKFQFFGYFVVDQGCDPVEALRKSSRITQTVKWQLLGFGLLCMLINWLGAIVLLVGLFVTVPTTLIAYAVVYRKLLEQTESAQVTLPQPA
ncbi:hypothetical protein AYK25_08840 [Thermoplasmatales archaeon SM1-50]|nr:MAG: hypothetical protein AYK25_08840 [Thermoplasmatales archaeon SM1-50]